MRIAAGAKLLGADTNRSPDIQIAPPRGGQPHETARALPDHCDKSCLGRIPFTPGSAINHCPGGSQKKNKKNYVKSPKVMQCWGKTGTGTLLPRAKDIRAYKEPKATPTANRLPYSQPR